MCVCVCVCVCGGFCCCFASALFLFFVFFSGGGGGGEWMEKDWGFYYVIINISGFGTDLFKGLDHLRVSPRKVSSEVATVAL